MDSVNNYIVSGVITEDVVNSVTIEIPSCVSKDTGEECVICMDTNDQEWLRLQCSHSYHRSCIYHWLSNHRTCPVCRYQVVIEPQIEELETVETRDENRCERFLNWVLDRGLIIVGSLGLSVSVILICSFIYK